MCTERQRDAVAAFVQFTYAIVIHIYTNYHFGSDGLRWAARWNNDQTKSPMHKRNIIQNSRTPPTQ